MRITDASSSGFAGRHLLIVARFAESWFAFSCCCREDAQLGDVCGSREPERGRDGTGTQFVLPREPDRKASFGRNLTPFPVQLSSPFNSPQTHESPAFLFSTPCTWWCSRVSVLDFAHVIAIRANNKSVSEACSDWDREEDAAYLRKLARPLFSPLAAKTLPFSTSDVALPSRLHATSSRKAAM